MSKIDPYPFLSHKEVSFLSSPSRENISPHWKEEEEKVEKSLRPETLSDFLGQSEVKRKLEIFLQAAKKRKETLDHTLFCGPPGLGKTSLAQVIAREMGGQLITTSGPALEKTGDLAAILTNLQQGDLLFIDEIHRLNRLVEESLYPALEDFHLDLVLGQGPSARVMRLQLPRFTLIGATTRAGLLTSPLMSRFGITFRLNFYSSQELQGILLRSATILHCSLEPSGAMEISQRARGTPRIANQLLKRVRDFAQIKSNGIITEKVASEALSLLEVDCQGLDPMDRQFLRVICEKFGGGPVGIETLSSILSEEKETLEDVYEPFLMQQGFIHRTSRGRVATELAFQHLQITYPFKEQ